MAIPQGLIYYGGVRDMLGGSYTMTAGVNPNQCVLTIPPQNSPLAPVSDLYFSFGPRSFALRRCLLDSIRATHTKQGLVWQLTILDRRVWWTRVGAISGYYNVRSGENTIQPGTEKSARELGKTCLVAMGEKGFDCSALPDNAFPETDWDYMNPALALDELCRQFGCVVVLGLNDRVRVWRLGQGATLPPVNLLDGEAASNPPDPPASIVLACKVRYQVDLELEAMALETDGSYVPLYDVSYAPIVNGRRDWRFFDARHCNGLSKPEHRNLAQQSVFRAYRIKTPFRVPGVKGEIKDLGRVLPLESRQVETWEGKGGRREPRPPWVYGSFWGETESHEPAEEHPDKNIDNKPRSLYTRGFQLDAETGMVHFQDQCTLMVRDKQTSGRMYYPARMWLRVACGLRDEKSRGWIRKEYELKAKSKAATGAKRYEVRDDLAHEIYTRWGPGSAKLKDNEKQLKKAAEYYLNALALEYKPQESGGFNYIGLLPYECDGAITQVTWTAGKQGATTRVNRNREDPNVAPKLKDRRLWDRTYKLLLDQAKPARQRAEDMRTRRG